MTADQYRAALSKLGLYNEDDPRPICDSRQRVAKLFRRSERQVHAYWLGDRPIPWELALIIRKLIDGTSITMEDIQDGTPA